MYRLQTIHKILYNSTRPPLSAYMEHFIKNLDESVITIETDDETIDIIFLQRHVPHLMGLHHFVDEKSKNPKMKHSKQLEKNKGFTNMLKGRIFWEDLENSRGGSVWKENTNLKTRALSIHLIKEAIFESDIYRINGTVKNGVNGKYLLVTKLDHVNFNIILDEDIEFDRLDKYYCCISNLINDKSAKELINSDRVKKLDKKRIIHKDFTDGFIREVKVYKYPIKLNNSNIITKQVKFPCIKELMQNTNCCYYAAYIEALGLYNVSYLYFDKETTRTIDKYLKLK